jgi:NAD(P)-dependent dehydrogenase (short-subunit alcohol dehydrogenase family)
MTIVVTGAPDGLGRALSLELARRGQTVLLHGRSDAPLAETVPEIAEATGADKLPPR